MALPVATGFVSLTRQRRVHREGPNTALRIADFAYLDRRLFVYATGLTTGSVRGSGVQRGTDRESGARSCTLDALIDLVQRYRTRRPPVVVD